MLKEIKKNIYMPFSQLHFFPMSCILTSILILFFFWIFSFFPTTLALQDLVFCFPRQVPAATVVCIWICNMFNVNKNTHEQFYYDNSDHRSKFGSLNDSNLKRNPNPIPTTWSKYWPKFINLYNIYILWF